MNFLKIATIGFFLIPGASAHAATTNSCLKRLGAEWFTSVLITDRWHGAGHALALKNCVSANKVTVSYVGKLATRHYYCVSPDQFESAKNCGAEVFTE